MAMASLTTIAEPNGNMAMVGEVGIAMRPFVQTLGRWKDICAAEVGATRELTTQDGGLVQNNGDWIQVYEAAF